MERYREHRGNGEPDRRRYKESGADASLFRANAFTAEMVTHFDKIAFGCPSMGAEELEESEFEPMFSSVEKALNGKTIALFGSYGWGDGQWMRDWQERCAAAGADIYITEKDSSSTKRPWEKPAKYAGNSASVCGQLKN